MSTPGPVDGAQTVSTMKRASIYRREGGAFQLHGACTAGLSISPCSETNRLCTTGKMNLTSGGGGRGEMSMQLAHDSAEHT